ncbi:hypothetical protein VP01_944g2 [Puccinia sorghi]|uniref:Uncharacterized protein n=1 Tax=Puccinia sorghi TaxID=27349 RepID=A0A0L6U6K6_9BASI|nr:hypothetical protein VP01_944g2 [Puccinia sorghi]
MLKNKNKDLNYFTHDLVAVYFSFCLFGFSRPEKNPHSCLYKPIYFFLLVTLYYYQSLNIMVLQFRPFLKSWSRSRSNSTCSHTSHLITHYSSSITTHHHSSLISHKTSLSTPTSVQFPLSSIIHFLNNSSILIHLSLYQTFQYKIGLKKVFIDTFGLYTVYRPALLYFLSHSLYQISETDVMPLILNLISFWKCATKILMVCISIGIYLFGDFILETILVYYAVFHREEFKILDLVNENSRYNKTIEFLSKRRSQGEVLYRHLSVFYIFIKNTFSGSSVTQWNPISLTPSFSLLFFETFTFHIYCNKCSTHFIQLAIMPQSVTIIVLNIPYFLLLRSYSDLTFVHHHPIIHSDGHWSTLMQL